MGVTCSPAYCMNACSTAARAVARDDRDRSLRAVIVAGLVSLIFVPEYVQGLGDPASKSFLYGEAFGGLRVLDVLLLTLAALHAVAIGIMRQRRRYLPRSLMVLLSGFGVAILVSIFYGVRNGGQNFFFDWRALALGAGLYLVYRFWIQTPEEAAQAIGVFAVVVAARVGYLLLSYAAGTGDTLLGIRIPIFDGPTISAAVFAALLGIGLSLGSTGQRSRILWLLLATGALIFVALCFRRTYWAELGLGLLILALLSARHALRILVLVACVTAIAWFALGPSLAQRIASLDIQDDEAPYAEDNSDHVGDILDAWEQVRESPVMGIGLGRSYPTWRIRSWKDESVMVHNAPLHVWLKYGLLGLAFYLAFHLTLFRSLRRIGKQSPPARRAWLNAVLAYLAAQFVVSLGFTPWPYSAVQSTNLIALLLAIAYVRVPSCHFQQSRWLPQPTTAPTTSRMPSSA